MITDPDRIAERLLILLLLLVSFGCANIQQAERSTVEDLIVGEPGNFHGYKMYSFNFKNRACRVVAPRNPDRGYPWVWRAHFFGHRPEVDLALLARGFYVAWIDVADLYGSPEAVRLWNDFYRYLTSEYQFSDKVALEGMSAGGLIAFNWAAANPEKVSCIYLDAPVLDIRSWPGGFKKGRGSRTDWQKSLQVYGISEEEALSSEAQPAQQAALLAEHDIPLIVVSGDADDVVPYEENAGVVADIYKEMKGRVKVILKQESGHSHGLDNPQPVIDFILRYTRKAM